MKNTKDTSLKLDLFLIGFASFVIIESIIFLTSLLTNPFA